MDAPASPPAPDGATLKARLATLQKQIRDMRLDLTDTLDLIDRPRANCLTIKAKLAAAEHDYALLLKEAERM